MIATIAQALLIILLVGSAIGARVMHGRALPRKPYDARLHIALVAGELLLCVASWGWFS